MKYYTYRALARGVILESLRRKDLWVVAILGFVILLSAGTLGFFGFEGLEVFAKDLAVTVLGLFSTIIAVLTSSRLLPDEIKNRTLYPLLARPITRFDLLVGKLIGAIIVTWISFLMLAALTAVALVLFHVKFELILLQYLIAKMMGLAVLCSMTLAFSAYLTPAAGATISFIFAFGSSMIVRALVMSPGAKDNVVFKLINGILPQFSLYDFGGRAVYSGWSTVPLWVFGYLLGYGVVYSVTMLSLGWCKFNKQAI
jgi:ABC-type transport system involved in multi-copper enzyme maturation permease subunit